VELEEVRTHLLAIDRWQSLDLPRLSDEDREWVHARMHELCSERLDRRAAHRERVAARARYLGQEVASHRMLISDAQSRLTAMATMADGESIVPMSLVPFREAVSVIEESFAAAYRATRLSISREAVA
jgi:hypothetical protein